MEFDTGELFPADDDDHHRRPPLKKAERMDSGIIDERVVREAVKAVHEGLKAVRDIKEVKRGSEGLSRRSRQKGIIFNYFGRMVELIITIIIFTIIVIVIVILIISIITISITRRNFHITIPLSLCARTDTVPGHVERYGLEADVGSDTRSDREREE